MELRTVDPRVLRTNPANPRRTFASPEADAMLAASIDPDTPRRQVNNPAAREVADCRLASAVHAEGRYAGDGSRRAGEYDGGAIAQQRERLLHREQRAFDVGGEGAVEIVFGYLLERRELFAARIGEEDVDDARSLPPALAANVWKKGQSGNPKGKQAEYYEMQRIAREASPAAAKRLVEMAYLDAIDEDGNLAPLPINADRRIVSWAVDKLMERAWGKPKEYDPLTEKDPNKPKFDPRLLSPQQLDIVEYALKLMVQATRAPGEATVIEQPAADDVGSCPRAWCKSGYPAP